MAKTLPVRPALFDIVIDYAKQIQSGKIKLEGPVSRASPLVTFSQNFFAQFFDNEVADPITTIGPIAKRSAVAARHRLRKRGEPASTLQLIAWFERFCDRYPDILALSYMGSSVDFRDFLTGDFLELVNRIGNWARDKGYVSIEKKSNAAHKAIAAAIARQ